MTKTVLILGAAGRFGRHAVTAFAEAGWQVRAQTRPGKALTVAPPVAHLPVDLADQAALDAASTGTDLIVNALNPPYTDWATEVPRLTEWVIAAARAADAPVLLPGNVYNFGRAMPELLDADTPQRAETRKGRIRIAMEAAYRAADVQTILLRAGDFIDTVPTGNWFESHIAAKAHRGRLTYPGPTDVVHAWAWLPDLARAAVAVAEQADRLSRFADIPFPGYAVTGDELAVAVAEALDRPMRIRAFPWPFLGLIAPVAPMIREVLEMRYLWQRPHRLDGSAFAELCPDVRPTPLIEALRQALAYSDAANGSAMSTQTNRWSDVASRSPETQSAPNSSGSGQKTPASRTRSVAAGST